MTTPTVPDTTPKHSNWGASKFEQIMLCPGSVVLQDGLANTTSKYAAEGTAAHQVLTWALQQDKAAAEFIGNGIAVDDFEFEVDEDMARHVQVCIDYVRDVAGHDGVILVDQRVDYSDYLGLPPGSAYGTLDVAVLKDDEIISIDFKYGMGVEVSAERNVQVSLYALGILDLGQGLLGDFARARLVISQPRITVKPSEYPISVEELEAWGRGAARSAVATAVNAGSTNLDATDLGEWEQLFLRPGEKQCKFCRAKATCPALRNEVSETVHGHVAASPDEFVDWVTPVPDTVGWLAACLSKVDLIEDWCKAVRTETERRMLAGETIPGYKLVQGKRGPRAWSDATAAEELLRKVFRLPVEVAYDLSLKSPTQIAKLGPKFDKDGKVMPPKDGEKPPAIGPRQWPKVQALITQPDGKKHVAPLDDPRPAIEVKPVVEDFDVVDPGAEFA